MAIKETKKKATVKKVKTPVVNEVEVEQVVGPSADEVQQTVEEVIESINNADVSIKVEKPDIKSAVDPLIEMANKIESITKEQEEFAEKIKANPEQSIPIIEKEIEKLEKIKTELNKPKNQDITSWWNGSGF